MPTLREIYAAGITATGGKELEARTRKYRVFHLSFAIINGKTFTIPGNRVFLGKAGAFRVGRTSTSSFDVSRSILATEIRRLGQIHYGIASADEKISLEA